MQVDRRRFAPAAERNREPILTVLREVLPSRGLVLEIASGSGQHVCHFAAALPDLRWQPSDASVESLASVDEWVGSLGLDNVLPALHLDVTRTPWPVGPIDAVFNANMIHIAPWEVCQGLMRGAGSHLVAGGTLVLYGPFRVAGAHTAPSNADFDASLRDRNPAWGVRDLEAVGVEADARGLDLVRQVQMPANNLSVIFRRRSRGDQPR